MNEKVILASELFATNYDGKCEGPLECHWCTAPCQNLWIHDDPPPIPFVKSNGAAKRPGNMYICKGCWWFRRPGITTVSIDGIRKDRQAPVNFSWWITQNTARVIYPNEYQSLLKFILNPPGKFALMLLNNCKNMIQLGIVNQEEVKADTILKFTMNNIEHKYTINEMEDVLTGGSEEGKEAGTRLLIKLCATPQKGDILDKVIGKVIKKRGRPRKNKERESLI